MMRLMTVRLIMIGLSMLFSFQTLLPLLIPHSSNTPFKTHNGTKTIQHIFVSFLQQTGSQVDI